MNYGLSQDQMGVLDGLERLIASASPPVPTKPMAFSYAADLDAAIAKAGFYDIAREEGFGPLDAALVVERLARLPHALEAGASCLIAPALSLPSLSRPIALMRGAVPGAARFLPMARVLIWDRGCDAVAVRIEKPNVESLDTLFAYPYGRLRSTKGIELVAVKDLPMLRRRWRVALAVEAAGAMAAALAVVIEHVKTRQAFGRPLGAFQALQHRLAIAAETAESAKWLSFRAAWSDKDSDATVALGFAQSRINPLTFDLHQFCGAMGLTLEFPLHHWTYRLRAIAGELGGAREQTRAAALETWPAAS